MISGVSWRSESVPLLKIFRSGGFDAPEKSHRTVTARVIPAKAGIQTILKSYSCFCRNDKTGGFPGLFTNSSKSLNHQK
jgi:hypothetical protein